jgi:hypothetical protein
MYEEDDERVVLIDFLLGADIRLIARRYRIMPTLVETRLRAGLLQVIREATARFDGAEADDE